MIFPFLKDTAILDYGRQSALALSGFSDELHPDLEASLCEDESGFIDHELLRVPVMDRKQVASVNALYLKTLARSDEALKVGNWYKYVWLRERPYRLNAFVDIMDNLNDQPYWELLSEIWVDCENVWQNRSEWTALWNSGRPEKQFAMNAEEHEVLALLPSRFTIYRGCHECNADGLSWNAS